MLPQIDLPIYSLTIPSTGKQLSYRPFTVKEEKLLLMASESGEQHQIFRTIIQIINNCTFGKIKKLNELGTVDVEYIFIHLRKASISETIEAQKNCEHCDGEMQLLIELDNINIHGDIKNKVIKITDNITIELRNPSFDDISSITDDTQDLFVLLGKMLYLIVDGDTIHKAKDSSTKEREDFILSLPTNILETCADYMTDMAELRLEFDHTCIHCKEINPIKLTGLINFFV